MYIYIECYTFLEQSLSLFYTLNEKLVRFAIFRLPKIIEMLFVWAANRNQNESNLTVPIFHHMFDTQDKLTTSVFVFYIFGNHLLIFQYHRNSRHDLCIFRSNFQLFLFQFRIRYLYIFLRNECTEIIFQEFEKQSISHGIKITKLNLLPRVSHVPDKEDQCEKIRF